MDYNFNNLSRIDDTSQRQEQNIRYSQFTSTNNSIPIKDTMNIALSEPNVNYSGTYQVGPGGFNIETSSKLIKQKQSANRNRTSINQRLFNAVPYIGQGTGQGDLDIEYQLKCGDVMSNRKTITKLGEKTSYSKLDVPLVPYVAGTLANPMNHVESNVDKSWIRGGVSTREQFKNK
jgi:hypothetical protein